MRRKKIFIWIAVVGVFAMLCLGSLFVVGLQTKKQSSDFLTVQGKAIEENISASLKALDAFQPEEARLYLEENLRVLGDAAAAPGSLSEALAGAIPLMKDAASITKKILAMNLDLLALVNTLADLEENGFQYFMENGETLISGLEHARDLAQSVVQTSQEIKNTTTRLEKASSLFSGIERVAGDPYLSYGFNALGIRETLDSALRLFKTEEEQRIVMLLVSERKGYRPGGGVIEYSTEVSFKNGQVTRVLPRAAEEIVPAVALRTQPPAELQGSSWNFPDALWFFDYPESAQAVLSFLGSQEKKDAVPVAGVALITQEAFEGLSAVAGEKMTMDKIPVLLDRLAALDKAGKQKLGTAVGSLILGRELLFFASLPEIETFLKGAHADGGVFGAPKDFWGFYAGLAYGDVFGAEDSPLKGQALTGKVDIDGKGNVLADVTLEHTFSAGKTIKQGNRKGFVELLTLPGTEIISFSGNNVSDRSLGKRLGTGAGDDNVLRRFEAKKMFLKELNVWTANVFGAMLSEAFLNVSAKGRSLIKARVETPPQPSSSTVAPGNVFRVVLERQAGVPTKVSLRIFAPFGYVWKESGEASFLYEAEQLPGRVDLSLTLEKS